jgi:hypothetical protein
VNSVSTCERSWTEVRKKLSDLWCIWHEQQTISY